MANWLIMVCAAIIVLHVAHLPNWLVLLCGTLLAWRGLIDQRGWPLPGRWLRLALATACLVLVWLQYGTLLGRDAGTGFLAILAALKLLETRSRRDFLLVVFLQFFLILAAFLYSESLATGLAAFALGGILTATLARLGQTQAVSWRHHARLAGGLLLRALPVMLALYLLFPRIQGSLWGMPADTYSGVTGLSDTLAPGSISRLNNNDAAAFRALFDTAPPPAARYWRVMVLTDTDGHIWRQSVSQWHSSAATVLSATGQPVDYTVLQKAHPARWLPALDMPATAPPRAQLRYGQVLVSNAAADQTREFRLRSYPDYRSGPLDTTERHHMLLTPPPASPRVAALVARWHSHATRPAAIIRQALAWFHDQPFVYTLSPPRLGAAPLDEFLFDTRRGYCEHYAFAMAMLMRYAGIPSRIVVGFQGGEWNPAGHYLLVRQSDAHAWTELWLAGRGWTRVDPTAAIAPERIEFGMQGLRDLNARTVPLGSLPEAELRRLLAPGWVQQHWRLARHSWDAANTAWNRWVMAYGPATQRMLLERFGIPAHNGTMQAVLMLAAAALAMLVIAALLFRPRSTGDPATTLYRRFCARLARAGIARYPAEGPLTYAGRVARRRPELATAVRAIVDCYIKVRYDPDPLPGHDIKELRRRINRFRVKPARPTRHHQLSSHD